MFDPFACNATTATTASTVRIERLLESFRVVNGRFLKAASHANYRKRELCLESQRIAARLEPRSLPLASYVPRAHRSLQQPPGRFAFYRGNF